MKISNSVYSIVAYLLERKVENQVSDAWDKCVLNEAPDDSKPWESLTWPSYEQVFWHLDKMLVGADGGLEGNEANDNIVTIVLKRRNKFGSLRSEHVDWYTAPAF